MPSQKYLTVEEKKEAHRLVTLKYVHIYRPTLVPYAVSSGLAIKGLRDDTMESREKSGTRLARSRSETDL